MAQFSKASFFILLLCGSQALAPLSAQDSFVITSLGDGGAWDDPDTELIDEASDGVCDDGTGKCTTYNGKELWIFVNSNTSSIDQDNYGIFSIEIDVMKQEVSALDIKGSIASQGKIALYGIHFDTGKSDIKPESEKAINSVAAFLKENPEIKVYIVGHTDNVGDYEMNQKLSRSRGESVKNYLVSKYQISATRLTGDGAGPICPVTSNDNEEGRTLNRRVEIVKK